MALTTDQVERYRAEGFLVLEEVFHLEDQLARSEIRA